MQTLEYGHSLCQLANGLKKMTVPSVLVWIQVSACFIHVNSTFSNFQFYYSQAHYSCMSSIKPIVEKL